MQGGDHKANDDERAEAEDGVRGHAQVKQQALAEEHAEKDHVKRARQPGMVRRVMAEDGRARPGPEKRAEGRRENHVNEIENAEDLHRASVARQI